MVTITYSDLRSTGLQFENGEFKCHKMSDIELTSFGDMALEDNRKIITDQELANWLATVPGERLDPFIGCALHDYMFTKSGIGNGDLGEIENVMAMNVRQNFPHLPFKYLRAGLVGETSNSIYLNIVFSNDALKFIISSEELANMRKMLNLVASMEFVKEGEEFV